MLKRSQKEVILGSRGSLDFSQEYNLLTRPLESRVCLPFHFITYLTLPYSLQCTWWCEYQDSASPHLQIRSLKSWKRIHIHVHWATWFWNKSRSYTQWWCHHWWHHHCDDVITIYLRTSWLLFDWGRWYWPAKLCPYQSLCAWTEAGLMWIDNIGTMVQCKKELITYVQIPSMS